MSTWPAPFFPEGREPKFVNAVLDHMAREAKPEAF
jgi:N utilization substance protein B